MNVPRLTFRIVYYMPDLFLRDRFAIGAVILGDPRDRFVGAARMPCARCLGGVEHVFTVAAMTRRLRLYASEHGSVVSGYSPHVEFGPAIDAPLVGDVDAWLRDYVLPRNASQQPESASPAVT